MASTSPFRLGTKIRSQRTNLTGKVAGYTVVFIEGCAPRSCYVMQLDKPITLPCEPPAEFTFANTFTMLSDFEYTEEVK